MRVYEKEVAQGLCMVRGKQGRGIKLTHNDFMCCLMNRLPKNKVEKHVFLINESRPAFTDIYVLSENYRWEHEYYHIFIFNFHEYGVLNFLWMV